MELEEASNFFDDAAGAGMEGTTLSMATRDLFGESTSFFGQPPTTEAFTVVRQQPDAEHAAAVDSIPEQGATADSMQHESPDPSPAIGEPDAATQLKQQADALKQQHASYHTWLVDYLAQSDAGSDQGQQSPADIPTLLGSMYSAWLARTYLHYHKEAAEAGKELERCMREAEGLRAQLPQLPPLASSAPPGRTSSETTALQQYLSSVNECIGALGTAWYAQETAAYYSASAWAAAPQLQQAAAALDQRLQQSRYSLYQQITQDIQDALEALAWPPALVPAAGGRAASGEGAGATPAFRGFGANAAGLDRLNGLLASLNRLQMATERQAFAALMQPPGTAEGGGAEGGAADSGAVVREGPLLWSIGQLTSQLQVRLQSHFSPGTEAGRLDHPEWLFKTVIGFLKANVSYAEELQTSIVQSGLQEHYHATVEFARAVREAVRGVLRGSRLPALLQEAGEQYGTLWLLQVDAMLEFEKQLAPYLGALHDVSEGELPESLAAGSCLCAITQEPDFLAAWAAAERGLAESRVAPWEVQPGGPSGAGADGVLGWGAAEQKPAWRREFNAPAFAERVVDAVTALVERSRHAPSGQEQRAFLELSVGALLDSVERQLHAGVSAGGDGWESDGSAVAGAATAPERAPLLCASVNSAHYLHHQLSELLLGPALYRVNDSQQQQQQQQGPAEPQAGGQMHASASPALLGTATNGLGQSVNGFGDVVMKPSFLPADQPAAAVLAARASALAALHREWCLLIARDVARGFGRLAVEYREEVMRYGSYPAHPGAVASPCQQFLPALAWLQQRLALLAEHLDGPSFRDIWRAGVPTVSAADIATLMMLSIAHVLVPINRFMFNHIATECRFSAEGGEQLEVDAKALAGLLAPYTSRPAAHMRETLAAAKILSLSDDEAGELVRRVSSLAAGAGEPGAAYRKDPLLVHLGAACLLPQQIMAVVACRT